MSSSEISEAALTSDSAEVELVTASQWREEWTARDTASVRLQLLGRVLCCRNKPPLDPLQGRHFGPTVQLPRTRLLWKLAPRLSRGLKVDLGAR